MRAALASLALAALAAAFAPAGSAEPGRISVGLDESAVGEELASAAAAATAGEVVEDLGPLRALVLRVPDVEAALAAVRPLPGVAYAEPVRATRTLAFTPNDPLVGEQWYLSAIRAFDYWATKPTMPPVRVAVVDSGIDAGHAEFRGRIAASRSFVSSPADVDSLGHGTAVAGEIAAALDNAEGIAGVGVPVQLLVAKVLGSTGEISILAEAKAIRWAVDRGARVINLSLGGPRDPRNRKRDTYSALEHAAIDYATRRGVVVVAAAGNCLSVACPERYANYPAALPHVLGVAAVARDGSSPAFSNRDRLYNDLAAPGTDIVSTYPRALSSAGCPLPGYTPCARSGASRVGRGTSFSAPLVSAAAALLVGERGLLDPRRLHSSQVTALLARSARDLGVPGRDSASGKGRLDVEAALASLRRALPPRDRLEANDDAGPRARALVGSRRQIEATLDRFDDVRDVYRIRLGSRQRVVFGLVGPRGGNANLALWRPGTRHVTGRGARRANRVAASARPGSRERIVYRARRAGVYFLEVRLVNGRSGPYRLSLAKGA